MTKRRIIYNNYSPRLFDLGKAEGSYIWIADGDLEKIEKRAQWTESHRTLFE